MSALRRFSTFRARLFGSKAWPSWLPPTLARYVLGIVFVASGYSKLMGLAMTTEYFASLGIGWPGGMAALVGAMELGCGALLLVGLASRVATIPLVVVMIVALATAKSAEIVGLTTFAQSKETAYLVLLLLVLVMGPGAFAADTWLAFRFGREARVRGPAWTPSAPADARGSAWRASGAA